MGAWTRAAIDRLCSHLLPEQIEFLEDPPFPVDRFRIASDATAPSSSIVVWKPMVRGLPPAKQPLILSSALESSIGLQSIASLLLSQAIPHHTLGLGTLPYIEDDVVLHRAWIQDGQIHFPSSWTIKTNKLSPC